MSVTSALHCELYNAALQNRRDAWRLAKKSIGHTEQANSLREVKEVRPEFCDVNQMSMNATLRRLDRAFSSFFRRLKASRAKKNKGETAKPGYPRFKSSRRYRGWDYPRHGNGCRLYPSLRMNGELPTWRDGSLYLQNIGKMKFRGLWPAPGDIRCLTIRSHAGKWFASIVVQCVPLRKHGGQFVGLDWGVTDYATLAYADGTYATLTNDRLFKAQQEKAAERQRRASKRLRGRKSRRAKAQHLAIGRTYAKLANQRKDRSHKASAKLVASCRLIATEKLQIANMTRSAKGTEEDPGKNVAQKAGLNREILDTAPGLLIQQIRYKAEEAGCEFVEVNTRRVKPSQTCPQCDVQVKKRLDERQHRCGCGFEATRDQAAALVILKRALEDYGRKPTGGGAPENAIQNGSAVWVA